MKRRQFIAHTAKIIGSAYLAPLVTCLPARAATQPSTLTGAVPPTLVFIDNLGAMDALAALQPHRNSVEARINDDYLSTVRPNLLTPHGLLLPLDSTGAIPYALHPNLSGLHRLWNSGNLSVVFNAGFPRGEMTETGRANPNLRSHFEQMRNIQTGISDSSARAGILNRTLASLSAPDAVPSKFSGVALQNEIPTSLRGSYKISTLQSLSQLDMNESLLGLGGNSFFTSLQKVFGQSSDQILRGRLRGVGSDLKKMIEEGLSLRRVEAPEYGTHPFHLRLKQAADLIIKGAGRTRVIHIPGVNGLDTHINQVTRASNLERLGDRGALADKLRIFGDGLESFCRDLSQNGVFDNVIIVAMSEFSRTIKQNGSFGSDHGGGTAIWIAGGRAKSQKFLCESAPIQDQNLSGKYADPGVGELAQKSRGSDLYQAFDYRRVFAEIFKEHMGISDDNLALIFKGLVNPGGDFYGVTRARV